MKKKNIVIIAVIAVMLILIFSVIGGYNGLVENSRSLILPLLRFKLSFSAEQTLYLTLLTQLRATLIMNKQPILP